MLVGETPKAGSGVEVALNPFELLEVPLIIGSEELLVDPADLPGDDACTVKCTATV
jgi:hypothetical protein